MIDKLRVAFPKTMKLSEYLGLSLTDHFTKKLESEPLSKVDFYKLFYEYVMATKANGDDSALLEEVLSIEYEKTKLKDSPETIAKISKQEKKWNAKRNEIFNMPITDFMELALTKSPLVKKYESDWEIVSNFLSDWYVTTNILKEKSDFYFLFQRIGVFDKLSQNNIIEYPLDRFEYIVLQLFENSTTIGAALDDFLAFFDCNAQDDFIEVERRYLIIVKSAIFRKFLVQP